MSLVGGPIVLPDTTVQTLVDTPTSRSGYLASGRKWGGSSGLARKRFSGGVGAALYLSADDADEMSYGTPDVDGTSYGSPDIDSGVSPSAGASLTPKQGGGRAAPPQANRAGDANLVVAGLIGAAIIGYFAFRLTRSA